MILTTPHASEARLAEVDVQGYPVIVSNSSRLLVGYIGGAEIRYVLGTNAFSL